MPAGKTILETRRLVLREMSPDDHDFLAEMLGHAEVMRYWPRPSTREEAMEWIERQQARYARDGVGYWLAIEKESGQPIGQAGLLVCDVDGVREMGLGYMMHRPFWRLGYATEASQANLEYATAKLGTNRIIALVRPENIPSQGVARKLGMSVQKSTQYAGFQHLVFVAAPTRSARPETPQPTSKASR